MSELTIQDLAIGTHAKVVGYNTCSLSERQKLLAMGLTPGCEFQLTRIAPFGDPLEIQLRGFTLSLRKLDAKPLRISIVA